jgi:hypothetical protein
MTKLNAAELERMTSEQQADYHRKRMDRNARCMFVAMGLLVLVQIARVVLILTGHG